MGKVLSIPFLLFTLQKILILDGRHIFSDQIITNTKLYGRTK